MPDEPNVPISVLASLLAGYPYVIEGKWFYRQNITLDGYKFVRCRFDNCNVYTTKGTFSIDRCFFGSCMFYYNEESKRSVQLFIGTFPAPDEIKKYASSA